MPKLTDAAVRSAAPGDKPRKLFDNGGLYLLVQPNGARYWRLKYRFAGKEKLLAIGVYPAVSLKDARQLRDEARRLLAQGDDPSRKRESIADTFRTLAARWLAENVGQSKPATVAKHHFLLGHLDQHLGDLPPRAITAADIKRAVKAIHAAGIRETAARSYALCSRIFRYAVVHDLTDRNPAADVSLRDLLPASRERHHAALTHPTEVGGLLRAIDDYKGSPVTRLALRLAAFTFVRPGELRHAEWSEFGADEWRLPDHKMKAGEAHLVPLSAQARAVLDELQPLTGGGPYLFPCERTRSRPMSENTINAALRRLGYSKDEMTGHGFRSMASTLLHELGYPPMVIERQLAHAERNAVAAAYNRAEFLPERRKMMQAWADYLDGLKAGGAVVGIKRGAK